MKVGCWGQTIKPFEVQLRRNSLETHLFCLLTFNPLHCSLFFCARNQQYAIIIKTFVKPLMTCCLVKCHVFSY